MASPMLDADCFTLLRDLDCALGESTASFMADSRAGSIENLPAGDTLAPYEHRELRSARQRRTL